MTKIKQLLFRRILMMFRALLGKISLYKNSKKNSLAQVLWVASAFSLPPKILEMKFPLAQSAGGPQEISAITVEKWGSTPNSNGGMKLVPGAVELLSDDGSKVFRYNEERDGGLAAPQERARTQPLDSYFVKQMAAEEKIKAPASQIRLLEDGTFFLELPRGPVETLWKLSLGVPLYGVDIYSQGARPKFTAWSAAPSTLLKFDWGLRSDGGQAIVLKAHWPKSHEVLSFEHCKDEQMVVVERVENGLVQVNFFRSRRPEHFEHVAYAKINVAGNLRPEEVSSVRHKNCEEFYFAGTFGLVRARFKLEDIFKNKN